MGGAFIGRLVPGSRKGLGFFSIPADPLTHAIGFSFASDAANPAKETSTSPDLLRGLESSLKRF